MSAHRYYSEAITRSVHHIFKHFLQDESIEEVFESQAAGKDPVVAVEIEGTIKGEVIINLPANTLDEITKKFIGSSNKRTIKKCHHDVAGELANLITGTFANQMQYADHNIILSAPEFNEDPLTVKALYDNVNLSFQSIYGGFDIDLYYQETEQ